MISIKKLNDILTIDHFVHTFCKLTLPNTGKDAFDLDFLTDVIVMKKVHLVIGNVAK